MNTAMVKKCREKPPSSKAGRLAGWLLKSEKVTPKDKSYNLSRKAKLLLADDWSYLTYLYFKGKNLQIKKFNEQTYNCVKKNYTILHKKRGIWNAVRLTQPPGCA